MKILIVCQVFVLMDTVLKLGIANFLQGAHALTTSSVGPGGVMMAFVWKNWTAAPPVMKIQTVIQEYVWIPTVRKKMVSSPMIAPVQKMPLVPLVDVMRHVRTS